MGDGDEVRDVLVMLARDMAGERAAGLGAAVELDRLAGLCRELAGELVRDAVYHRRAAWPTVARAFGVSRQAAMKRFGRKGPIMRAVVPAEKRRGYDR